MNADKEITIIRIEKKQKESKDLKKDIQICYICQEKPIDPIDPAGCNHFLCKNHLKVIQNH
jgi:hypothetical protein